MRTGRVIAIEAVGQNRRETLDEVYDEVWDLALSNVQTLVRGKASRDIVRHYLPDHRTEGFVDEEGLTFAFYEGEGCAVASALSRHFIAISVEAMREGLDMVLAPLGWRLVGEGGVEAVRATGDRFMEVSGQVYRVTAREGAPAVLDAYGETLPPEELSAAARKKAARVAEGELCLCELCRKLDAGKGPIDPMETRRKKPTSTEFTSLSKALQHRRHARTLALYERHLTELSPDVGKLAWLEVLYLWDNLLRAVPPEIGQLRRLRELHLGSNRELTSLPEELGQCVSLEKLTLDQDYALDRLPDSLANLRKLKHLTLSSTSLERLPEWFAELQELESLNLYEVPLQEPPVVLLELSKLRRLDLRDTAPAPFLQKANPEVLGRHRGKESLLRAAVAEGQADAWLDFPFDRLRTLESLQLRGPSRLPGAVLRCETLAQLDIAGRVGGTPLPPLPEGLASLPELRRLSYWRSETRELPAALLARGRLTHLSVEDARIEEVPDGIGALAGLVDLRLGGSPIRAISDELFGCRRIEYLSLRGHALAALPEELRRLPALKMLWD